MNYVTADKKQAKSPTPSQHASSLQFKDDRDSQKKFLELQHMADSSPRVASGATLQAMINSSSQTPIQRMLMYNNKQRSGEIEADKRTTPEALAGEDGLFSNKVGKSYAEYLESSPYSIGVPNSQNTGLKELAKRIKAATLDKATLTGNLAESAAYNFPAAQWSDDWLEEVFKKLKASDEDQLLPSYIDKDKDFDDDKDDDEGKNSQGTKDLVTDVMSSPGDYDDRLTNAIVQGTTVWLNSKITKNKISDLVPELNNLLDATMYDTFGAELLDLTGVDLNTAQAEAQAIPLPIWVKLMNDLNQNNITKMAHNGHYDTAYGHGAEFKVETPQEKKESYQNQAVLHTHYDDDGVLNKAHTKPFNRRYDRGYGKYDVKLSELNKIDDTRKDWDDISDM
ncbi:MAG: hypothetical protein AAFX87_24365 [Bacteroidota bacterium]